MRVEQLKAAADALSAAAFYTGFYRYVERLFHAQQLAHLSCVVRCHVAVDNLHAAVNVHDATRFASDISACNLATSVGTDYPEPLGALMQRLPPPSCRQPSNDR